MNNCCVPKFMVISTINVRRESIISLYFNNNYNNSPREKILIKKNFFLIFVNTLFKRKGDTKKLDCTTLFHDLMNREERNMDNYHYLIC